MDKPSHPSASELQSRVKGRVLEPASPDYDAARRIWNAMIDRRPAAIVRCEEAGDIPPALAWCRDRGLDLSIRGGGHNIAAYGGNYARLKTLKKNYDPQNVFHHNQNIVP